MIFNGDVRGLKLSRLRGYGATATRFLPDSMAQQLGITGALSTADSTSLIREFAPTRTLVGAKVLVAPAAVPMTLEEKGKALEALGFKVRAGPASAPREETVNLVMQVLGFRGGYTPEALQAMLRAGDPKLPVLARDAAQWQYESYLNNMKAEPGRTFEYPEWLGSLIPPPPKPISLSETWAPLEALGFNLRDGASYRTPDEARVRNIIAMINDELKVDPDSAFNWPITMAMIIAGDPQVYEAVAVIRKQLERDILAQQVGAQKSIDAQNAKIADVDTKIAQLEQTKQAVASMPIGGAALAATYQKQIDELRSQRNGLVQFMPTIPQIPSWFGQAGLRTPPAPAAAPPKEVVPVAPSVVTDTGTVVPATALPDGARSALVAATGGRGFLKTYWPLLAVGAGALTLLTVVAARRD